MNHPPKSFKNKLLQLRTDAEASITKMLITDAAVTKKDKLLYELQVHQIELKMQNDELQTAHLALEKSHSFYLNLFEFAPIGYLTLNTHGLITEANFPAASLLGVERRKLLQSPFSRYLTLKSADRLYLKMLHFSVQNDQQNYEIEIKREDGTLRNVQVNALQAEAKDGGITWLVTLMDFTEKKKVEDARQTEKAKRAAELVIANKELSFQNDEKENRAAELAIANTELIFQNDEKAKRAAELVIANTELIFQNNEKAKRASELVIANFQRDQKAERAAELTIINKELSIAATAFESQEGIIVTDAHRVILRVNQAFTSITGYSSDEAIGQSPRLLNSGRQNEAFYAAMWNSINVTGMWEGEIWNRRKSGEVYPEHLAIKAVKDVHDTVTNYVATLTDITMSKAATDKIYNLAFYDSLTQLPNRRLLLDRLNQALTTSARSSQFGALLFLDLDHFKTLNDTLGHDMGDLLLQQVAERLTATVRLGDTVARIGGDEFVVILDDLSKLAIEAAAQTKEVAEKIIISLNKPYQLNTHVHISTPSIGATLFKGHEVAIDELMKQADIAMYESKTEGRNTLRFFDPAMQVAINARADMERELRKAIEKQQFQLHYQIQVNSNGQALGAEALIRWLHPERGLIPPFNFIPLAEETGMILPIGQWVLDTACAQLKKWQKTPLTQDLVIAVNVSAKQFFQKDFVEQVNASIQRHDINPTRIELELTESILVENINDIITKMDALSKLGIQFSLDDFGTGYSSLQYLKKLPLNQLKIDQSFVRDIVIDSSDRAIVRTIITMAHSLDINVIAEGVETDEQRQLLLDNGCTHYQGYLFSKPVPIDAFEALLLKS